MVLTSQTDRWWEATPPPLGTEEVPPTEENVLEVKSNLDI